MATDIKNDLAANPLGNEQGTAIITAMLVLMLLTFVGISSTKTTITEKAAVRSEAIFQKNFFFAESAAMEGVQRLDNESAPKELVPELLTDESINTDLIISATTDEDSTYTRGDFVEYSEIDVANTTYRVVAQMPISSGSSLALGSSRLYTYNSYGLSEANGGRSMIKVGFKKRF